MGRYPKVPTNEAVKIPESIPGTKEDARRAEIRSPKAIKDMREKLLKDPRMNERWKVRALQKGEWGYKLRREGDVFTLMPRVGNKIEYVRNEQGKILKFKYVPHLFTCEEQFSETWMERVDDETPTSVQPRREELDARKMRERQTLGNLPSPFRPGVPALDDSPQDFLPDGPLVEKEVI